MSKFTTPTGPTGIVFMKIQKNAMLHMRSYMLYMRSYMNNVPRIVTSVDEFIEVISEDRVWLSFEDFSLISEVLEIRIHIIDVYNAQMKDRLDFHLSI